MRKKKAGAIEYDNMSDGTIIEIDRRDACVMLMRLAAMGLLFLVGWSRSFSQSLMSLSIYAELVQNEKARNTGSAIRSVSFRKRLPPKKGAAKSRKFLIQCLILNILMFSTISLPIRPREEMPECCELLP
jgi:hypothetical protein